MSTVLEHSVLFFLIVAYTCNKRRLGKMKRNKYLFVCLPNIFKKNYQFHTLIIIFFTTLLSFKIQIFKNMCILKD